MRLMKNSYEMFGKLLNDFSQIIIEIHLYWDYLMWMEMEESFELKGENIL